MKVTQTDGHGDKASIAFLTSQSIAALATIDSDGSPSVATIYYTVAKPPNILFITKSETAKLINIRSHPIVALAITDEDKVTTLQLKGRAKEVTDPKTIGKAFDDITSKSAHPQYWPPPIVKMKRGDFVVVSITPFTMKLSDYRHF